MAKCYCGILFIFNVLTLFDFCLGGELCYDSIQEKYQYCSGYCCGDGCCNVDVGAIIGVAIAGVIGLAAIIGVSICICLMLSSSARWKPGWRGTVIHPRNLDDSFNHTTSVSYTTCRNEYQNGVFTYTLPSRFHLVRQDPSLTPIMTPSLSPILPPPYSPRTESPPKQDND